MNTFTNKQDFLKRFVNIMLGLTATTTVKFAVDIFLIKKINSEVLKNIDLALILCTSLLVFIVSVRFFFGLFLYIFEVKEDKYTLFFVMCIIQSIIFSLHSFTLSMGIRYVFLIFIIALLVDFIGFPYILKYDTRLNKVKGFKKYFTPLKNSFNDIFQKSLKDNFKQIRFFMLIFVITIILNLQVISKTIIFNFLEINIIKFIIFIITIISIYFILKLALKRSIKIGNGIEWRWAINNMLAFIIIICILLVNIINNGFNSSDTGIDTRSTLLYFSALFCGFWNSYIGLSHSFDFYQDPNTKPQ
jgi:hypothetical protein